MYVVYCWENPNSLNKLYLGIDGLTKSLFDALKFETYEEIIAHKEAIINYIKEEISREYFIGELEPTCRGFLGEF